jgi:hypothetical protein
VNTDVIWLIISILFVAVGLAAAVGLAIWPTYKPGPMERHDVIERFEVEPKKRRWLS